MIATLIGVKFDGHPGAPPAFHERIGGIGEEAVVIGDGCEHRRRIPGHVARQHRPIDIADEGGTIGLLAFQRSVQRGHGAGGKADQPAHGTVGIVGGSGGRRGEAEKQAENFQKMALEAGETPVRKAKSPFSFKPEL